MEAHFQGSGKTTEVMENYGWNREGIWQVIDLAVMSEEDGI